MKKVKALLISMMMILSGCAASDDRDDVVVLENTQFKLESTGLAYLATLVVNYPQNLNAYQDPLLALR